MSNQSRGWLPHSCIAVSILLTTGTFFGGTYVAARGHFLPSDRSPTATEAVVALAMDYAENSSEANDLIFLGDSTCFVACLPNQFERQTGLRAYNLGVFGGLGFRGFAVVLREYLRHHPPPRMILLAINPSDVSWSTSGSAMFDFLRERFFVCYGGTPETNTWARAAATGVRLLTGSAAKTLDVPLCDSPRYTYRGLQTEIQRNRGTTHFMDRGEETTIDTGVFAPSESDLREAAELVRAARGCPIALVFTPSNGRITSTEALRSTLKQLGFEVSHAAPTTYSPQEFSDHFHLNAKGSQRFTAALADTFGPLVPIPKASQVALGLAR